MTLNIVTGGSRGLGKALIEKMLSAGQHVAEISRNGNLNLSNARSFHCDFKKDKNKKLILDNIFSHFNLNNYSQITLVNNAGMVDPVGFLNQLNEENIYNNVMVNLFAPMALTAAFLSALANFNGKKIIVNVSTGVAKHPKATWSAYCATKAGLESLSAVTAMENEKATVINYEPGIIDTEMQALLRAVPSERFPEVDRFVNLKNNNELAKPQFVAEHLFRAMQSNLPNINFISVNDKI